MRTKPFCFSFISAISRQLFNHGHGFPALFFLLFRHCPLYFLHVLRNLFFRQQKLVGNAAIGRIFHAARSLLQAKAGAADGLAFKSLHHSVYGAGLIILRRELQTQAARRSRFVFIHGGALQITVRAIPSPCNSSCKLASCSSAFSPVKQELSKTTCAGRALAISSFNADW